MPLYCLSLGEEEEELALKLTSEDSESHLEPIDQVLQEKKVKLIEMERGWCWWKGGWDGDLD